MFTGDTYISVNGGQIDVYLSWGAVAVLRSGRGHDSVKAVPPTAHGLHKSEIHEIHEIQPLSRNPLSN